MFDNVNKFNDFIKGNKTIFPGEIKKKAEKEALVKYNKNIETKLGIDTDSGIDTVKLFQDAEWIDPTNIFSNEYNFEDKNSLDLLNDKDRQDRWLKLPSDLQKEVLSQVDTKNEFDKIMTDVETNMLRDQYLMNKEYGVLTNMFGKETGSILGMFGGSMIAGATDPTILAGGLALGVFTGGVGSVTAQGVNGLRTAYTVIAKGRKYYSGLSKLTKTGVDALAIGSINAFQEKLLQDSTLKSESYADMAMAFGFGATLGGAITGLPRFMSSRKIKKEKAKLRENGIEEEIIELKKDDNLDKTNKKENGVLDNNNEVKEIKNNNVIKEDIVESKFDDDFVEIEKGGKEIDDDLKVEEDFYSNNKDKEQIQEAPIKKDIEETTKQIEVEKTTFVDELIKKNPITLGKVKESKSDYRKVLAQIIRTKIEKKKIDFKKGAIKEDEYINFIDGIKNEIKEIPELKHFRLAETLNKKVSRNVEQLKETKPRKKFVSDITKTTKNIEKIINEKPTIKKLDNLVKISEDIKKISAKNNVIEEVNLKGNRVKLVNQNILHTIQKIATKKNVSLNTLKKLKKGNENLSFKDMKTESGKISANIDNLLDNRIKRMEEYKENVLKDINTPKDFDDFDYGSGKLEKEDIEIFEKMVEDMNKNMETILGTEQVVIVRKTKIIETTSEKVKKSDLVTVEDIINDSNKLAKCSS